MGTVNSDGGCLLIQLVSMTFVRLLLAKRPRGSRAYGKTFIILLENWSKIAQYSLTDRGLDGGGAQGPIVIPNSLGYLLVCAMMIDLG
ncbi:hypothetical protein B0J17DRAFT_146564 [Rhizoctonia solani]|nr:hypothetical protein B0J17DRAFT_146564 [Rhizoctonia solani]